MLAESDKQGAIVEAEEYESLEAKELTSPENWVHHRAGLLLQGRVKPFVKAEEDEEAGRRSHPCVAASFLDMTRKLFFQRRTRRPPRTNQRRLFRSCERWTRTRTNVRASISCIYGSKPHALLDSVGRLWTFRVSMPPGSGFKHAVASARSLTWPGAVAVAKGSAFSNIYVGNGLRQLATPFRPPLPMPFAQEFQDDEDEPVLRFQEDPLPPPAEEDAEAEAEDN